MTRQSRIAAARRAAAAIDYVAIASVGQQRLWMMDALLADKATYNNLHVERLTGRLDVAALERAVNQIIGRHDVLRTHFAVIDGALNQLVATTVPVPLMVEDLTGLPQNQVEDRARSIVRAEVAEPMDLGRGPLFRVRLLRLAVDEHWLLVSIHHIVSDRWSMAILFRELSLAYGAFSRGEAPPLPELPIQYADYAEWQHQCLQGDALERLLAYWRPALAALPTLDLPVDRARPAVATQRGGVHDFEIDEGETRALKALGRQANATLFMTLLAVLMVLLHRHSGQEDIAVGVPMAGRDRVELEGLIGFFINTLVLRGDLRGEPTFTEFLAQVRRTSLGAYEHAGLPFEKLVEVLAPSRDLSRNPLHQVYFKLGNTPAGKLELPGVTAHRVEGSGAVPAKFDLSLAATETDGRLRMHVEYAADLFDAATIERMMGHYRLLLQAVTADPSLPVGRLPMLGPEERRRMLVDWNDTAFDGPAQPCIARLFERQVALAPEATAVVSGQRQLTYAELNSRANRLAHHLRALGVGPEVPVAVAMERSFELVVALLGILKAGGAYLPLDPGDPRARLAFLLADAQAPILLAQRDLADRLPEFPGTTLCLDADWPLIAARPDGNPANASTANHLAYVIHTSGSTGQPKGAMIEQRSVTSHIAWMQQRFAAGAGDCVLQSAPIGFDQSIWQLLFALTSGGRVALLGPEAHRSADEIVAAIRHHRVSLLRLVPTMLAAILRGPGLRHCPSLRLVIVAGEALERDVVLDFASQCAAELANAYGPTETTFVSTLCVVDREQDGRRPAIGRPLGNVRAYVLDRYDQPVPVGVAGELCVGGKGVGRGYWRRPDLTAQVYVRDPFDADPRARMYRTGDIARYRPDGNLEFLGRRDHQIKLRGFRIELGEIEASLALHPKVQRCVVNPWTDANGDQRLAAYCVATDPNDLPVSELREFLRTKLPAYMLPAAYVELPALPLTASGKIDRRSLAAPRVELPGAAGDSCVGPRGEIEERIAAIWKELLRIELVSVFDDFFDLGGHSLLAMRMLSRIQQDLGVAVTMREFFESPRIANLGAIVERERRIPAQTGGRHDRAQPATGRVRRR